MNNKANMLLQSGIIYRATDWTGATYADGNGTNEDETLTSLTALTYEDVGLFTDASFFHSQEDAKVILTDYCSVGEVRSSAVLTPRLEFTWQEIGDIAIFASILGLDVQSIAASPIAVTAEAHGTGWVVGRPFKLNNKDGDNTIVASIVVKEDNVALNLTTDYVTYVGDGENGELGYTYIVPVSAQTGVITADYSYTPSASKLLSYNAVARTIPYQLFKLVTCANEAGQSDTFYLVKGRVSSEMQQQFINEKRTDFAGSQMVIQGAAGSNYFWKKETLTAIA